MVFKTTYTTYDISPKELEERYIDEGQEAVIYKFYDEVLKVYKTNRCIKRTLNESDIKKLSMIKTKRIILPKSPLYNDGVFAGYTMPYITPYNKQNLKYMTVKKLIQQLTLMKEDIIKLSENSIDIDDLSIDNTILSDGLYLIDPGSYIFRNDITTQLQEILNKEKFNEYVIYYILHKSTNIPKKYLKQLYEMFSTGEYISDMLDYKNEKETINQYVRRVL